jgi:IS5 family transposase
MTPRFERQITFGSWLNQGILDPKHKLFNLAEVIDWEAIHDKVAPFYSNRGRKALPVRLMVGLHFLKHMEDLSDAQCSDRVRGDLYWMHFCGVDVDSLKGKYSHLNSSSMTKFRNRLGDKGWESIEDVIREYLLESKKIDPSVMATDSSCMEKNVEYPTDSGLLDKGRRNLLQGMQVLKNLGIKAAKGVRSYAQRSKRVLITIMKLGKDRADRIKAGTLELAQQAVHVLGKCEQMIKNAETALNRGAMSSLDLIASVKLDGQLLYLKQQVKLLKQVVHQSRQRFKGIHIAKKIYSLHEPQVIVIRKGKRSKQNEYGSKFNISVDKNGYIVSHELYQANKHDSVLLDPALKNWEEKTGTLPRQLNADRGYVQKKRYQGKRFRSLKRVCIPTKGKTKHPEAEKSWFKNGQAMRAGIEAVIGHLKQDHRIDRSRYSGFRGDKINLCLGATAWNLNKLARSMK